MEQRCCCEQGMKGKRIAKISEITKKHRESRGALIPVLHEIQDEYGYLPKDVLYQVSEELKIPITEIYGVASFYSYFSLEPKGEHVIRVCLGTACYVKGAQVLLDKLSKELNVNVGKTTENGKFTLEATRCLGACGLAPVLMIDEKVYGRLVPSDIIRILKEYE